MVIKNVNNVGKKYGGVKKNYHKNVVLNIYGKMIERRGK